MRNFGMTVDGTPRYAMHEVIAFIDDSAKTRRVSEDDIGTGSVVRPSERSEIFSIADADLDGRHAAEAMNRVSIEVCYCSLLKDCRLLRSSDTEPQPVRACAPQAHQLVVP